MVFLQVDPQVLLPGEPLPAVRTSERPLPGVDALVRLQVSGLREALPALSAAVRSLARVNAKVRLQTSPRRKPFPTVTADETTIPAEPTHLQWVQLGSCELER